MSRVWKNEQGQVILEDGRIVLCEDCPCEGSCQCEVCVGTRPSAVQVTIDGLVNGFCLSCTDYNSTFTVPSNGAVSLSCGIGAASPCGYLLCLDLDCGSNLAFCDSNSAALYVCLGTNLEPRTLIYVRLESIDGTAVIWELELEDCPLVCDDVVDLEIPLLMETGGGCFPSSPTCHVTFIP